MQHYFFCNVNGRRRVPSFLCTSKYFVSFCRRECLWVWNYEQSLRKQHSVEELRQPFLACNFLFEMQCRTESTFEVMSIYKF